jgi:hypothetical protein
MNRYERSILLERLVALRSRYGSLDGADSIAVMTIDEAVSWAEALLDEPGSEALAASEPEPAPGQGREQSTSA